tara:strand:+ start:862 stop:1038 length:177 start_codon:yes stop_codon:yes gene_type:complete
MYKVRTTYKDNDLAVETYDNLHEARMGAKEECMYSETEYSLVYDEEDKEVLGRYKGWL